MAGAPPCSASPAVVCVVLPLVALIMRDRPQDVGLMPYGETGEIKPACAREGQSGHAGLRRAARRGARQGLLAARRHLFRLRRLDQRPDRHPSHSGLHRPRLLRSHRRGAARHHGRVQFHRHHQLRLARRQVRQPLAAVHLLRPARAVAVLPAVLVRRFLHHDAVRGVLRPRLVRHRLADGADARPTPSAATRRRWSMAGCSPRTSSAARRRRSSPACFASTFDDYMAAFMLSGTLCLVAAVAALFIGGGRRAPERAAPVAAAA